jgi:hypothetical protein
LRMTQEFRIERGQPMVEVHRPSQFVATFDRSPGALMQTKLHSTLPGIFPYFG